MSKVSSRGRITIPVEIRRALDLSAGDRVEFKRSDDGLRIRKWRPNAAPSPEALPSERLDLPHTIDEQQVASEQTLSDDALKLDF